MMLRDMRPWVFRRIMDPQQQRFSQAEVDSAINQASLLVQKEVMRVSPDAFRRIYTRNLVSGVYRYPVPVGLLRTKMLMLDYSGSGTFSRAGTSPEDMIETGEWAEINEPDPKFCVVGGEVVIWPTPSRAVTGGMKLYYAPCLAFSDDDYDPEVDGLVQPLHIGIVLYAAKMLMPEDGEDTKTITEELREILSNVGDYYSGGAPANGPGFIRVEGLK